MSSLSQFGGGGVKQIVSGELSINGSVITATMAVPAVDIGKAVVFFRGVRYATASAAHIQLECCAYLINATTVQVEKGAGSSGTNATVAFTMVEFK